MISPFQHPKQRPVSFSLPNPTSLSYLCEQLLPGGVWEGGSEAVAGLTSVIVWEAGRANVSRVNTLEEI